VVFCSLLTAFLHLLARTLGVQVGTARSSVGNKILGRFLSRQKMTAWNNNCGFWMGFMVVVFF
jgi:hypothetical protein